ncbi:MAG: glycoside hydrolase family 27 protein [Thermoflavifilum sp.]|nr:glycoside hydrolase family 27 protein [Thermoflavifilum sp.]
MSYVLPVHAQHTPPMGWNSYDCFGATVTENEVKENARWMADSLSRYGWQYVVVDFCWFYPHPPGSKASPPPQFRLDDGSYVPWLPMDEWGRLLPDTRKFPSAAGGQGFKPLADYVHSLGLKFGIHVMRGIPRQAVWAKTPVKGMPGITADQIANVHDTCGWLNTMFGLDMSKPGAQAYLNSLLTLYASWGVDFIKIDDITQPYHAAEILGYRRAIDSCGRDIILSLSPGETPLSHAKEVSRLANMWRLSGDLWDNWHQLRHAFDLAAAWVPYARPGHWPDIDMLPVGHLSLRGPVGPPRYAQLSHDELQTMITLWCITRMPLMIGGNLPDNRPQDTRLETNPEAIEANQGPYQPVLRWQTDSLIIWQSADTLTGKQFFLAFFNLKEHPMHMTYRLDTLVSGNSKNKRHCMLVKDVWKGKILPATAKQQELNVQLPPHGCALFKLSLCDHS